MGSVDSETISTLIKRLFPLPAGFRRMTYFSLLVDQNTWRQWAVPEVKGKELEGKIEHLLNKLDAHIEELRKSSFGPVLTEFESSERARLSKVIAYISSGEHTVTYPPAEEGKPRDDLPSLDPKHRHYIDLHKQKKSFGEDDPEHVGKIPAAFLLPPFSPFDMFAVASTLLLKSGAYHHVETTLHSQGQEHEVERGLNRILRISPEKRRAWAIVADALRKMSSDTCALDPPYMFPPESEAAEYGLLKLWSDILQAWHSPVYEARYEADPVPGWWESAFALMAIADSASSHVGFNFNLDGKPENDPEQSEWTKLGAFLMNLFTRSLLADPKMPADREPPAFRRAHYVESISLASRSIVNVLPKSRTAPLGCTLRSTSLNLANLPGRGSIRAGWFWASENDRPGEVDTRAFNALLIPYPYEVRSTNFRPVASSDVDGARWGSFDVEVRHDFHDVEKFIVFVMSLLKEARKQVGKVHAIILPEMSISWATCRKLIESLQDLEGPCIDLLCAGIREHPYRMQNNKPVPINAAFMATFKSVFRMENGEKAEFLRYEIDQQVFHEKHHRWRLTNQQIQDYDLSPSLDPSRTWWENLRVVNRRLPIFVMNRRWTMTALICEDLARNDPARTVVEAIGPDLVLSILMDGPQIPERWPARYATVLAEDPGSSVLSMSSIGLIDRSNKIFKMRDPHFETSRSFALWRDDTGRSTRIDLEQGSHAVAITLSEFPVTDFTLDGRRSQRSPIALRLTGMRQIRDPDTKDLIPWEPPA